jgi:hypothetical protein
MVLPFGAMFQPEKMVTLEGTVKEFEYTNPHSWLYVVVRDDKRHDTVWGIAAEGPRALMRAGTRCVAARRPRHGADPSVARRPCGRRLGYGDQIATPPCSIHGGARSRRRRLRTDVTGERGFCARHGSCRGARQARLSFPTRGKRGEGCRHGAKGMRPCPPLCPGMIADVNIADGFGRA